MKSFQQNLLVALALALCGLCAYQWSVQTRQRNEIETLNQLVYQKILSIRDYTNSIATLTHQVADMDTRLTELRQAMKTNEALVVAQKREMNKLEAAAESLTNQVAEYKQAIGTVEGKLKDAYEGIKKQNESLKELVAQRDEFVQKYNDSVRERNDIVAKYNALVDQIRKLQAGGKE
jgi:chromosome segregation ATPase